MKKNVTVWLRFLVVIAVGMAPACELFERKCTNTGSCTQSFCEPGDEGYEPLTWRGVVAADEPPCEPGAFVCSHRGDFVLLCDDEGYAQPYETCSPGVCVIAGPAGGAVCEDVDR